MTDHLGRAAECPLLSSRKKEDVHEVRACLHQFCDIDTKKFWDGSPVFYE